MSRLLCLFIYLFIGTVYKGKLKKKEKKEGKRTDRKTNF